MELLLIIAIILLGFLLIQILGMKQEKNSVQQEINSLRQILDTKLFQQTSTLDAKLTKNAEHLFDVHRTLAEVKESNKHIQEIGKNISTLGDILKSPKLRGNLGEFLLSEALQNYFHASQFTLQYAFKSGEKVDACVHLHGGKHLCIDAKFPLENFQKHLDNNTQNDQFYKAFIRDVKKHVDAISTKYIQPAEGTMDFALMYVPAENVYYEMISNEEKSGLIQYCFDKHVIPVSPTTLFSYIQILLVGFQGMQIEAQAKQILERLAQLQKHLSLFESEYNLLGKHLGNARSIYDTGAKKLEGLHRYTVLQGEKEDALLGES